MKQSNKQLETLLEVGKDFLPHDIKEFTRLVVRVLGNIVIKIIIVNVCRKLVTKRFYTHSWQSVYCNILGLRKIKPSY